MVSELLTDSHDSGCPVGGEALQVNLSGLDAVETFYSSWSLQMQEQWHRWGGNFVALGCPGEMPLRPPFYNSLCQTRPRVILNPQLKSNHTYFSYTAFVC